MKNIVLLRYVVGFVMLGSWLLPSSSLFAASPTILGYQGRLANASGALLGGSSGTTYYFKFSLWNASSNGTKLWPSSEPTAVPVTVTEGLFNVNIGDTASGYPDALDYAFDSSDLFLKVEVSTTINGTYEPLTPRQRVASSAFAQVAGAVNSTRSSSFGTTTPFGNSIVAIESTSTSAVALTLRAITSQVANIFQIQNATGTNLFVVDNVGKVGVGTGAPARKFDVLDVNSVPQLRLSQTGSVYGEIYVDATGDVQLSSTGGNIRMNNENFWVCSGGSCGVSTPAGKGNIIVENAVIFGNNFNLKQVDSSTTIMYDTTGSPILEFDEGE